MNVPHHLKWWRFCFILLLYSHEGYWSQMFVSPYERYYLLKPSLTIVLVSLYLDLIIQLAQVPNDPRIQLIIPIFMRICIIIFFRPSPITQVQTDLDQKLDALLKYLTNRACQQHSHDAILTGIPRIIIDWVWLGIPNCNWVAGCYLYMTYFRKALRN